MVPASLDGFLTATSAASGALIGLLFVAVSLRPEAVFGRSAARHYRMLAESAFIALVNPFFLSLYSLLPDASMGGAAVVLGVGALVRTLRLHARVLSLWSSKLVLVTSVIGYGLQVVDGCFLLARPHDSALAGDLCGLMLFSFAVALTRAWSLTREVAVGQVPEGAAAGTPTATLTAAAPATDAATTAATVASPQMR